jgi:hypothetical protein
VKDRLDRNTVRHRADPTEFVARGMRSLADARKTGRYIPAEEVIEQLRASLAAAKARRLPDAR